MKQIMTVSEHQPIFIGREMSVKDRIITQAQAGALRQLERKQKAIFKWGDRTVTPRQYVGYIELPGLQIEILPKMDRKERSEATHIRHNLHFMLVRANEVPYREAEVASLSTGNSTILECYISVFIRKLLDALKKGMIHQYVPLEQNESFLKGKLLLPEQVKRNLLHKERFFIRYDEFSADNLINQAIKATVVRLVSVSISAGNRKNLQFLRNYMADIDEAGFQVHDFNRLHLSRMHRNYKTILDMAKVFWQEETPLHAAGKQNMFSLLFDMNVVFEKFIRNVLIENQEKILNEQQHVVEKKERKYLARDRNGRGVFSLIPDILIKHKEEKANDKIIDTKWKRLDSTKRNTGISQADMYQMYAYAREFQCREVVLLYPEFQVGAAPLPVYRNDTITDGEITIRICTIDLSSDMRQGINRIVEQLKSVVVHE